jgi:hypothetical protein
VSKKAATETDAERQTEVTNPLNFIVEPPGNYGRQPPISTDKFYLLTSADQMTATFYTIDTDLTKLSVAQ